MEISPDYYPNCYAAKKLGRYLVVVNGDGLALEKVFLARKIQVSMILQIHIRFVKVKPQIREVIIFTK